MRNYISSSSPSPVVQVDPSAPGTFFRYAAAIESTLNILGGATMMLRPGFFLDLMVYSSSEISHASISQIQWFGALTLGLTPQLLFAIPNTRRSIEGRRMAYITLGAGELALIPVFLWQAFGPEAGLGFSTKALIGATMNLLLPLLVRIYVLFVDPNLLGRYRDDRRME